MIACTIGVALAAACIPMQQTLPAETDDGPGQLSFAGSLHQTPPGDTIRIAVTVRNTGDREEHLSLGDCSLDVSFYRTDRDTSVAVWRQARWQPHPPAELPQLGRVCRLYEVLLALRPGESSSPHEYSASFATRDILGDSLPEGRYRVVARASYNDKTAPLSLGPIALRRSR